MHALNSLESLLKILSWSLYRNTHQEHTDALLDTVYYFSHIEKSINEIITPMLASQPDVYDILFHAPKLEDAVSHEVFLNAFHQPASMSDLHATLIEVGQLQLTETFNYIKTWDTAPLLWRDTNKPVTLFEARDRLQALLSDGEQHLQHVIMPQHHNKLNTLRTFMKKIQTDPRYAHVFNALKNDAMEDTLDTENMNMLD